MSESPTTTTRMPPQQIPPPTLNSNPSTSSSAMAAPTPPTPAALDQYRIQLYNYAVAERLRFAGAHPAAAAAAFINPYAALSAQLGRTNSTSNTSDLSSFFFTYAAAKFQQQQQQQQQCDPRLFQPQHSSSVLRAAGHHHHPVAVVEEPKPQHSYIGLIAMAILSSADKKLVLSDIYQYILDNYAYFRSRGPGWRNSIRHNLSLNDCFIKAGRSANGKGHYWAIHPANVEDFTKGDFRRRKAQRKVRKHMGLAVDEEDSPTPPPSPVTAHHLAAGWTLGHHHHHHHAAEMVGGLHPQHRNLMMEHHHSVLMMAAAAAASAAPSSIPHMTSLSPSASSDDGHHQLQTHPVGTTAVASSAPRKRLFDVASLLGRNDPQPVLTTVQHEEDERSSEAGSSRHEDEDNKKRIKLELDEDVDVVSEDSEEDEHLRRLGSTSPQQTPPEDDPVANKSSVVSNPSAVAASTAALWRFQPPSAIPQPSSLVRFPHLPAHRFVNGQQHPSAYFQQQQQLNHPSGMEQLTKYYEQVAEVMRINCLQQQQQQQQRDPNNKTAKHSV